MLWICEFLKQFGFRRMMKSWPENSQYAKKKLKTLRSVGLRPPPLRFRNIPVTLWPICREEAREDDTILAVVNLVAASAIQGVSTRTVTDLHLGKKWEKLSWVITLVFFSNLSLYLNILQVLHHIYLKKHINNSNFFSKSKNTLLDKNEFIE